MRRKRPLASSPAARKTGTWRRRFMMSVATLSLLAVWTIPETFAQAPPAGAGRRAATDDTAGDYEYDPVAFNRTFAHHNARVNGIRIHYVMGGQGDPVVLIHGWPETWYAWRKVMPALASRYTVIAPDMRGYGDSDKPTSGYDARTVADDVYRLVRQLGFRRIFLVGHDMGTFPAYAYAAAHPEDVRRLAILEEVLPGLGAEEFEQQQTGLWHWRFNQADDIAETLVEGKERQFIAWFLRRDSYSRNAITEADIDEYARSYSAPGGMRGAFGHYRAMPVTARQNRESSKRPLPMPVLAIGAEWLMGTAPADSMRRAASDVRPVVIKQCGHWIADERPQELVRQLLAFFGEERPAQ